MQEVKFTQIASYTGLDQQVQRVRFYLLNPAFMLGSPCKLYSIFRSFFCFFIITLVSEIVKEKLCRYRKYYRANKIGLSRAPAPTFTFENLPIQCYETKLATKGRPYSYSTVCYAAKSLCSVFPLLCVGVQLGLTPPFLTPHSSLTTVFS